MVMDNLTAELEAATEGSRKLELKIATLIDWHENGVSIREFVTRFPDANPLHWQFPKWTRSLDAALTLAAEDARWKVGDGRDGPWASVAGPKIHDAATPALALCIAAVRARQATEEAA